MRGKVLHELGHYLLGGITPAYAGKRQNLIDATFCVWDHPRLCGEKKLSTMLKMCTEGSPPPMRGKAQTTATKRNGVRITPAYAGKSRYRGIDTTENRDHPRLCGEKRTCPSYSTGFSGSPPPMRGKVFFTFRRCRVAGITPAYAGKR